MSKTVTFIVPHSFARIARKVLGDAALEAVKVKLALNPELGDLVPGTGGARKLRQVGRNGQSRVVYYFHAGDWEVFFLTCYPKNRQADLTAAEKAELKATVKVIRDAKRARRS